MQWQGVIDRIEGNIAVVLITATQSEVQVNIPLQLLPAETKEGDHLNLAFAIDSQSTADAQQRVKKLLEQLTNRDQ